MAWTYPGETWAQGVVQQWIDSPSHHAVITEPSTTHVGCGVAEGLTAEGNPALYCVALFSTIPRPT